MSAKIIRPKLPGDLIKIETTVKEKSGYPVRYELWGSLEGKSLGHSLFDNGVPVVRIIKEDNAIIAEELLHLELRLKGYYMPRFSDNQKDSKSEKCQTQIANLLQHQLIFPTLETLSYRPRGSKDQTIRDAIKKDWQPPCSDCYYCGMVYAIYSLLAGDESLVEKWKKLFSDSKCLKAREVGEALIQKITDSDIDTPSDYRTCLEDCLKTLAESGPFVYEKLPHNEAGSYF